MAVAVCFEVKYGMPCQVSSFSCMPSGVCNCTSSPQSCWQPRSISQDNGMRSTLSEPSRQGTSAVGHPFVPTNVMQAASEPSASLMASVHAPVSGCSTWRSQTLAHESSPQAFFGKGSAEFAVEDAAVAEHPVGCAVAGASAEAAWFFAPFPFMPLPSPFFPLPFVPPLSWPGWPFLPPVCACCSLALSRRSLYFVQCSSFGGSCPPPGQRHPADVWSRDLHMMQILFSVPSLLWVGTPSCLNQQETPRVQLPFSQLVHGSAHPPVVELCRMPSMTVDAAVAAAAVCCCCGCCV